MKIVEVVAAVIHRNSKLFVTQRGYGEFAGGWEFPGGKIEAGETAKEALVREIKEELDTLVEVGNLIGTVEYDYPQFHLTMHCFFCTIVKIASKNPKISGLFPVLFSIFSPML